MDAYGTARLAAKDAESAIVARICEDFNMTPVLARAHYEQMARYFADYGRPLIHVDHVPSPGRAVVGPSQAQVQTTESGGPSGEGVSFRPVIRGQYWASGDSGRPVARS